MNRYGLAVAALLSMSMLATRAQEGSIERQVRAAPGRDVRIGVYSSIKPDCSSGPLPVIRLVARRPMAP
jgi:hypothetical protein